MRIMSDKPLRVTTLGGSAVEFAPNEIREVGEGIGLLAIQMGATEVGDEPTPPPPIIEETTEEVVEEYEEDVELVSAMQTLIEEADPSSFKADGSPKAAVINKMLGRTVRTDEREAAWEIALNS